MYQLILVSTPLEIRAFSDRAGVVANLSINKPVPVRDDLTLMISGVGCPLTIFHLTRLLTNNSFDRIIQVGVAGSYKPDLEPGTLVEVGRDCFADLGIDDRGRFSSVFDSGLSDPDHDPFSQGLLINPQQNVTGLQMVRAITVNTAAGSSELIGQRISGFNPDIESMEGAAVFFVGFQFNIPVLQVRSISNFVEPRNRDSWEMDLAIDNLNNWLFNFVNRLDPD